MSFDQKAQCAMLCGHRALSFDSSVRTTLPDRASQLRHRHLPAVRRIVHWNDRLDIELETIDVVQQRDVGRIDGCGWRSVGLCRRVERIRLYENLLLRQI